MAIPDKTNRVRAALRRQGPAKRHRVAINLTDEEYILLTGLAAKLHQPVSEIVRTIVVGMLMRNEKHWKTWKAAARAEYERG